ncbi:MAG: hypothetical protein AABZ00_10770 [Chloroflexota bacterium]
MKFAQNMNAIQKNEFNAGGIVHVPPALCLPPARASAHVPAYVERTGRAVTKKMGDMGTARPVAVDSPILFLELTL